MGKNKYASFLPKNLNDYLSVYWGYYQHIEDEFISIFQSSTVDKYKAASLYLSIGSEIDVMFKVLILIIDDKYNGINIDKHREVFDELVSVGDMVPYDVPITTLSGTSFSPWSDTKWWKTYNMIKHQRALKDSNGDLYFSHATKSNIEKALGALYILERNYIDIIREAVDGDYPEFDQCKSKLFK